MQVRQVPDRQELGHLRPPISNDVSKLCSGQASAVSPWGCMRKVKKGMVALMGSSLAVQGASFAGMKGALPSGILTAAK
jgi:hypothetical protein